MRASLKWLNDYVSIKFSAKELAEKLTMAGLEVTSMNEAEGDTIMDIEVTPNRADCLSIIGIAREISAIMGKALQLPRVTRIRGKASLVIPVTVENKTFCPRYTARVIKNIKVGPSPQWLVKRLEAMGVRSINNIVDITNYCLLEYGQPLHAFDLDKLNGQKIIVRPAVKEEQIITIDGVSRKLDKDMLVIADKNAPIAIAGIMGGKDTEVGESTVNIVLEGACFDAMNIHNTSRKLGLASQSSYRFERGVDIEVVETASLRATELIKKLSIHEGKKTKAVAIGHFTDKGLKKAPRNKVRLRFAKVNQLLGVEMPAASIKQGLKLLGFDIKSRSKQGLMVEVPCFRPDVTREADLIEEAARLYGYENVPLRLSQLTPNLESAGSLELASSEAFDLIRQSLSYLGFNEIMTYSLISRQALRKLRVGLDHVLAVKNHLSYEQELMRPTLIPGMLNALITNINRKNNNLKLFELSRVYCRKDGQEIQELTHLAIAMAGKRADSWMHGAGDYCFFDLKGVIETLFNKLGVRDVRFVEQGSELFTPGRCAQLVIKGEPIGLLGELSQEHLRRFDIEQPVYIAELEAYKALVDISQEKKYVPAARFPAVDRDISLLVSQDIRSEQIVELIKQHGGQQVTKVTLFDEYFGEQIPKGFRGLSYSIEYRNPEKTLTSDEVDGLHKQVCQALAEELKAQLR